jgi:hypothetical protein
MLDLNREEALHPEPPARQLLLHLAEAVVGYRLIDLLPGEDGRHRGLVVEQADPDRLSAIGAARL